MSNRGSQQPRLRGRKRGTKTPPMDTTQRINRMLWLSDQRRIIRALRPCL